MSGAEYSNNNWCEVLSGDEKTQPHKEVLSGRAARIGGRRLGRGLAKTAQKPMRVKLQQAEGKGEGRKRDGSGNHGPYMLIGR